MPDASGRPVPRHPLVDEVIDGGVVHRSGAPLIGLTALMADLLLGAAHAGRRTVLRTPAATRLTAALAAALQDTGAVWLVEDGSGTAWDGLTGRTIARADAPLDAPEPEARLAPAFAAGAEPDAMQVVLAASVRHRRDTEARFGTLLESFAAALDAPVESYGPHEPLERAWDRAELAALVAARADAPRLLVAGSSPRPVTGSLLVRPTRVGFEEAVEATIALEPADPGVLAGAVQEALERSADEVFPLFGFVLARPGRRDLTRRPVLEHAPAPLAVLIGAPGVRDLGVDVELLVRRFEAVRVGRPRVPALLVPFGGRLEDWEGVDRLVQVLGPDRVAAAFGRPLPGAPLPDR